MRSSYGLTIITERGCAVMTPTTADIFLKAVQRKLSTEFEPIAVEDIPNVVEVDYGLIEEVRYGMQCCGDPNCSFTSAVEVFAERLQEMMGEKIHLHNSPMQSVGFGYLMKFMELLNGGVGFENAQFLVMGGYVKPDQPGEWLVKFPC